MCHTDAETVKVFQRFEQIEMGHCVTANNKSDVCYYKLR